MRQGFRYGLRWPGLVGIGLGVMLVGVFPAELFWLLLSVMFLQGFSMVMANRLLYAIFQSAIALE